MTEQPPAQFCIYQCSVAACALRFPAAIQDRAAAYCPMCRAETLVAEPAYGNAAVPAAVLPPQRAAPVAVLDNLRSTFNVGSIFRSAEGAGFHKVYLAGITPTPAHPKLAKTALGAEQFLAWEHWRNGLQLAQMLKAQGYQIWVLETQPQARAWHELSLPNAPLAVVVGNEIAGVDPAILRLADVVSFLPMLGKKASLNVAVAFGIAAYQLCWPART